MKGEYFTAENITGKSRAMIEEARRRGLVRNIDFKPERSALLAVDMQRYFLDRASHAFAPSAVAVIPRVVRLAAKFAEMARPVVLTRHMNSAGDAGMLARWWEDTMREDDPLNSITDELTTLGALTIRKTQYDAFYRTELERELEERGIEQLVVTGVLTHLCCETTARSAFVRGFAVFFAVDGTATYDEDFHRAAVLNLSHGFAVPVLTDDLISRMMERHGTM
jgi:isochorismate hydrolase